ncbi:MAG: nucleoid-structuring protein H-NS, partial [Chloroflexota bacterium]|nr:nucleoid-structuring protein H-NS [Chloroflexota bacterium]
EIYLVEVATGKRLWRGKFDETQKTLSKDVIRGFKQLKMGARWLTADELARYGVKKVLKDFPIH